MSTGGTPPPPLTASWVRDGGRRWVLQDATGRTRGELTRPGWTLRRAQAVIDGQAVQLRSGGLLTRHVEAQVAGGLPVRAEVGGVRWSGTVDFGDGRVVPLTRTLGVPLRFTLGPAQSPVLSMRARRTQLDMTFHPTLAQQDPALLPVLVLLWLHHERSTSQGG